MAQIRLVALDLDGTLLDSRFVLEPQAKEAIRRVQEKGVGVTLATGRMFRSALPFARDLGLRLPLIVYNGALIKDPHSGKVFWQRLLPLDIARILVLKARAHNLAFNIYVDDELLVEDIRSENMAYSQQARVPLNKVDDILSMLKEEPIKFVAVHHGPELDQLEKEVKQELGDRVYITRSFPHYLEIINPEASKAKGLALLAETWGISPEEIMVIGDSFNDVDMFHFAGLAVAMGNAPPAVQAHADYVTGTNDEGGVAEALSRFILER
ncbi:Cof-type HAD-IIB family hydrolase [Moorellaceae bacterium AZ2]